MVENFCACEECSRNCQLLHWSKRDVEPTVFRFFKIMIGRDFNEALFLPPKFAKNVKDLVGQETKLEDSRGICWSVTLSYYKGLLAFHEGWYEFSVDNDLKVGDFLVVNRIKGGHFVVHAFGRDSCEKLNTSSKRPPVKGAQISQEIAADNTTCQITLRDVRKTESSRPLVEKQPTKTNCTSNCEGQNKERTESSRPLVEKQQTKTNCTSNHEGENKEQPCKNNELYLMVDRDAGYVQSDYKTCLYDLSSFEMQQNICSTGKIEWHKDGQEVNPDVAQKCVKLHGDRSTSEIVVSCLETAVPINTTVARSKQDSVHLDDLPNDHPLPAASVRLDLLEGDDMSNVAVPPQSLKRNSADLLQSPQYRSKTLTKETETVKKVKVEIMEETCGCSQKRALKPSTREEDGNSFRASVKIEAVKIVPVDSLAVPSTVATSVTCSSETNRSAYINLPDCWPSVTFPSFGEGSANAILADPKGREWAGLYNEKFGFRVLRAPWNKINAENGIQPGDHLVFSVADTSLNKYKFDIVRKKLES